MTQVHFGKQLAAIQYTGEKDIKVRELMTSPLPTVSTGDILIVPFKTAKFLTREGKAFDNIDLLELIKENSPLIEQIANEAQVTIESLKASNLEFENQVKVLDEQIKDFEDREDSEIETLKEENKKLLEELTFVKEQLNSKPVANTRKTAAKKTTKALEGNS